MCVCVCVCVFVCVRKVQVDNGWQHDVMEENGKKEPKKYYCI